MTLHLEFRILENNKLNTLNSMINIKMKVRKHVVELKKYTACFKSLFNPGVFAVVCNYTGAFKF